MDLNSLKEQVSNLTLYDIKAGVRKVQNAVMNYTEMEAKVREATNNEPWGASSSLMQEIANGTHSHQLLSEIMPLIYKRFTDKTAEEWRQIYKSLQLLEYLIKNGSERVIDDARSHLSLLRMLRQFQYIDQNGKDQGVNVRNRAQELAKLLQDVDAIRAERKKARVNRSKFGGVEGGMGMSGGFSSNSRYGGFGSDDAGFGGYQGEVYGDGGGFGGNQSGFSDTQRRGEKFEEYDEGDDVAPSSKAATRTQKDSASRSITGAASKRNGKQKPKEPEQDLFDFGDEPAHTSSSNGKAPAQPASSLDDFGPVQSEGTADDDFDDFQSATSPAATIASQPSAVASLSPPPVTTSTTTSSTHFAAPKPLAASQAANFKTLFSTASPAPSATSSTSGAAPATLPSYTTSPPQPASQPSRPTGPNYYTSVPVTINTPPLTSPSGAFSSQTGFASLNKPSYSSSTSMASLGKPAAKPTASASGADAFDSLWSTATTKAGVQVKSTTPSKGPDLASMAKAKSEAGIWGPSTSSGTRPGVTAPTPTTASGQARSTGGLGNGLDDLLG